MNYTEKLQELNTEIHNQNVKAGWWTALRDIPGIQKGASILDSRNRAELLMLVVSEVSEADEGFTKGLNDDKLPHLPMFDVELADVSIRLFDMLGAENTVNGDEIDFDFDHAIGNKWNDLREASHERQLLTIVNHCSAAMEHLRKGRVAEQRREMSWAQATAFAIASVRGIDLFDVIQQKRDFNANRADHKVENRAKEGGKQF